MAMEHPLVKHMIFPLKLRFIGTFQLHPIAMFDFSDGICHSFSFFPKSRAFLGAELPIELGEVQSTFMV
jgi:hypothetical protein